MRPTHIAMSIATASLLAGCATTQGTAPTGSSSATRHTMPSGAPTSSSTPAPIATFPPDAAVQAKAYEGPARAEAEVATVFISDGRPRYEAGFICKINGRPVLADGGCASVVYLLPGTHAIGVRYRSTTETGEGEMPMRVEAGKLYQLNATSFRISNRGVITVVPMPQGSKVTYRNVAPNLFTPPKLDQPIPYPAQ